MTTASLRNRLKRLERATAPENSPCPRCDGRGVLEIYIGEDDPAPHPGCPACGRTMKVVLLPSEAAGPNGL